LRLNNYVDKDSHILFEKYVTLSEIKYIGPPKKDDDDSEGKNKTAVKRNREIVPLNQLQNREDNSNNITYTISGDDTPPDLPQDPTVKFNTASQETDPLYGAKPAGRGTGENPERKKLTQGDVIDVEGEVVDPNQLPAPKPAPAPKPTSQPQPQPAPQPAPAPKPAPQPAPAPKPAPQPAPAPQPVQQQQQPAPNVDQPSTFKNFVKGGARKVLKGLGKAVEYGAKTVDPFSKQGLLGKAATAARNAENWARSGAGDPYAAVKRGIKGTGGKLDIYDKKSGIEQQRAIQNYRNTYIYPRDKDTNLNQQVANLFGQSVSIDPQTGHFTGLSSTKEQMAAGIPKYSDILKRRKPITTAAHLANIILDIFVDKFRQGVPPDKAYNDAFNSVGNPLIIDYLLKNKLLPKQ
jgi:hypothetical protein